MSEQSEHAGTNELQKQVIERGMELRRLTQRDNQGLPNDQVLNSNCTDEDMERMSDSDFQQRENKLAVDRKRLRLKEIEAQERSNRNSYRTLDREYEQQYMIEKSARQKAAENARKLQGACGNDDGGDKDSRGFDRAFDTRSAVNGLDRVFRRPSLVGRREDHDLSEDEPPPPGTGDDLELPLGASANYAPSFLFGGADSHYEAQSIAESARSAFSDEEGGEDVTATPKAPKKPIKPKRKGPTQDPTPKKKDKKDKKEDDEEEVQDPMANMAPGAFADRARELVADADDDGLAPPVTDGMAEYIRKMFKKTKDLSVGKDLAGTYLPPSNLQDVLVPKMESAYYKSNKVSVNVKKADVELQLTQQFILASITAFLPVCELIAERGARDKELNNVGLDAAEGLRLAFFANTSLVRRRRRALENNIDSNIVTSVVNADVGGDYLLGDDLQETVDEAKKQKKLYKDLMPEERNVQPRGRARGRGFDRGGRGGGRGGRGFRGARGGGFNSGTPNNNPAQGFQNASAPYRGRGQGFRGDRSRGNQRRGQQHQSPLQDVDKPQKSPDFSKRK